MSELIAIAVGGALGALSRYWLTEFANVIFGTDFPYGILIINITGSFAIGLVFIMVVERDLFPVVLSAGLMVGFLGAFTTFSTFSIQAVGLIETERFIAAVLYIIGSVVLCIVAAAAGVFIARLLP
ncbi:MAG: fluoride efflux transporter CrcB [Pseudomonadales bacterium]|jgi:CrcB protein